MKNFGLIIIGCLLFGCSTVPRVQVNIDSIKAQDSPRTARYVLFPGNDEIAHDELQYQEYASYVERALEWNGFRKAKNFEDADTAIFLIYGMGDPETSQRTYSLPIIGQVGVDSSTTYGTLNTYGNSATYSGTTTYTPRYGVTGYQTFNRSYTT